MADTDQKPNPSNVPLGTGMANNAKTGILGYQQRQAMQMRDLGLDLSSHAQRHGYDKVNPDKE